jgi:large subunit ribosomal protein L10
VVNNNRAIKEAKVIEIKEKMSKAQGMIFAKYQGLTVEEDTELRKRLREAGIDYKVYKNSLTARAAKELEINGLDNILTGSTSVAFGYEDPTVPAKVLNDFAKEHKALELKGGVVQGKLFNEVEVKVLATIPSREVLIAKLLGSIKSPLSNLAYLLNAIKEQKESIEQA